MNELTLANLALLISIIVAYFCIKHLVREWDKELERLDRKDT